jgi:hypothetical protein
MAGRRHHFDVRTTLAVEDDAFETLRTYAKSNRVSLGKAASELIRRGGRYQLGIKRVNGFPVLDAPDDFPAITTKQVLDLLDEE